MRKWPPLISKSLYIHKPLSSPFEYFLAPKKGIILLFYVFTTSIPKSRIYRFIKVREIMTCRGGGVKNMLYYALLQNVNFHTWAMTNLWGSWTHNWVKCIQKKLLLEVQEVPGFQSQHQSNKVQWHHFQDNERKLTWWSTLDFHFFGKLLFPE